MCVQQFNVTTNEDILEFVNNNYNKRMVIYPNSDGDLFWEFGPDRKYIRVYVDKEE